jgi:hypothetical protein
MGGMSDYAIELDEYIGMCLSVAKSLPEARAFFTRRYPDDMSMRYFDEKAPKLNDYDYQEPGIDTSGNL